MKAISLLTIFLITLTISSYGQNERKFIRQGNKYYEQAMKDSTKLDTVQFNKAEIEYRKAIEKKPEDSKWNFNLADALYKQKKFDESAEKFKDIAEHSSDKIDKSRALHNMGNSMLMNNKLEESIEAYKQALRNNPQDLETKYNLLYAMNMKKKQDKQKKKDQDKNKDKDQNKDKNKDQKKDQNKDQKKDQDKKKDQQNKDQQQNQQQQQGKISKQNAEQMLQALENNEKKTQEKVKKIQALKAQSKNVDKDW
jgi:hypothetical protein